MKKNDNPFAIRKSPVELIGAQAVTVDDFVKNNRYPSGCDVGLMS